jgi:hypothetical protein
MTIWKNVCIFYSAPPYEFADDMFFFVFSGRDVSCRYGPPEFLCVGIHSQPSHSRDNIWALVFAPPPGLCSTLLLPEYFYYHLRNFFHTIFSSRTILLSRYRMTQSLQKMKFHLPTSCTWSVSWRAVIIYFFSIRLINGNDPWPLLQTRSYSELHNI